MDPSYEQPDIIAQWAPGYGPRDASPVWVDLPRVSSVSISRGRQEELDRVDAATCTLTLGGHPTLDDHLDPLDPDSVTVEQGLPFTPIRVRCYWSQVATTFDLFHGFIDGDAFTPVGPPRGRHQPVQVRAVDWLGWASQVDLPDSPYEMVAMADNPLIFLTGELARETPEYAYDNGTVDPTADAIGVANLFEGDSVIPESSLPSLDFTATGSGSRITQSTGINSATATSVTVAFFVDLDATLTDRQLIIFRNSGTATGVIGIGADGRAYAEMRNSAGTLLAVTNYAGSLIAETMTGSAMIVATWNRTDKSVTIRILDPTAQTSSTNSVIYGGAAGNIAIGGSTIHIHDSATAPVMRIGGIGVWSPTVNDITGYPASTRPWSTQYIYDRIPNLLDAVDATITVTGGGTAKQLIEVTGGGTLAGEISDLAEAFGGAAWVNRAGELVFEDSAFFATTGTVSYAISDAPDDIPGFETLRSTTRSRTGRRTGRIINWVELIWSTPAFTRPPTVRARDVDSIRQYGRKAYTPPRRAYLYSDISAIPQAIVDRASQPRFEIGEVTLEPMGDFNATFFALSSNSDLFKVVRYVETKRGSTTLRLIDANMRIQHESFDWADGKHWKCTYRLAPLELTASYPTPTATLTASVAASGDDATQDQSGGNYSHTSTSLTVNSSTTQASRYVSGLRFAMNIPNGATIVEAKLSGWIVDNKNADINVEIYVQNVDSAPAYTSSANGPNTRTSYTAAAVNWLSFSTTTVVRAESPNFAAAVQAAVARPGWSPGNYIGVILRGRSNAAFVGAFKSYDHADAETPRLEVTYET